MNDSIMLEARNLVKHFPVSGSKNQVVHAVDGVSFQVKKGASYQFRITAGSMPTFVAGSPSFRVEYAGNSGSNYFFKVYAIGNPGDACGFYVNKAPTPVAVGTVS